MLHYLRKRNSLTSRLNLVRWSAATGLLFVLCVLSIAPLVFPSDLPACCRRDGKHKCSMTHVSERSSESSGFAATALKCPLFPKLAPGSHGIQLYPFATQAFCGGIANHTAASAQAEIGHRISSMRAHHKRGPPEFPTHS